MKLLEYLNQGKYKNTRRRWWDILIGFMVSIIVVILNASSDIKFIGGLIFFLIAMISFIIGRRAYIAIGMLLSVFLALLIAGFFFILLLSGDYHG
jgi:hypothetical protein